MILIKIISFKPILRWGFGFTLSLFVLTIIPACSKKSEQAIIITQPPVPVKFNSPLTKKITDQTVLIKTFQTDSFIQITQGLSETIITYLNNGNQPMKIFILELDLNTNNLRLKAGTPNNKSTFSKQTVSEIARSQDTVGNRVLVALNGDFYNSSGIPQSVLYKNGVAIKAQFCDLCTFLAVDDLNKASIISKDISFDPLKIKEAVGGYHWLIKNSQKVPQGDISIEPRTAAGIAPNNMVYFIIVDGRQATYSNGVSFGNLSDIFFALGVKEAINLDGGGSSTLVIKENTDWRVKNKPSDGSQRMVANAWTIVDTKR
jgi:exopolysaccharide biosynthesis protein